MYMRQYVAMEERTLLDARKLKANMSLWVMLMTVMTSSIYYHSLRNCVRDTT